MPYGPSNMTRAIPQPPGGSRNKSWAIWSEKYRLSQPSSRYTFYSAPTGSRKIDDVDTTARHRSVPCSPLRVPSAETTPLGVSGSPGSRLDPPGCSRGGKTVTPERHQRPTRRNGDRSPARSNEAPYTGCLSIQLPQHLVLPKQPPGPENCTLCSYSIACH